MSILGRLDCTNTREVYSTITEVLLDVTCLPVCFPGQVRSHAFHRCVPACSCPTVTYIPPARFRTFQQLVPVLSASAFLYIRLCVPVRDLMCFRTFQQLEPVLTASSLLYVDRTVRSRTCPQCVSVRSNSSFPCFPPVRSCTSDCAFPYVTQCVSVRSNSSFPFFPPVRSCTSDCAFPYVT